MSADQYLPLISIITVTYNAAEDLERCISSVQSQSYPNIEHIIIDGASTDGTIEILKKQFALGNIAYWQSEPDSGVFNAMNKALKYTKGDWVYFLGADDFLYPEFSEMAKLLKKPNTIYYGQCLWGDMILGGEYSPNLLTKQCVCHHSILYPATVFKKYQYSEKYRVGGDHLLNIQCWSDKTFEKEYRPILIANFSKGGISETEIDEPFERDFPKLIFKYCSLQTYLRYKWKTIKNKNG